MNDRKLTIVMHLLISIILGFSFYTSIPTVVAESSTESDSEFVLELIDEIVSWKKSNSNIDENDYLFNNEYLQLAGETAGDWYPIGMGRIGYDDDYDAYLAVIEDVVQERYKEQHQLSDAKSTEWHRISLAILALGGDPTSVGVDDSGEDINLIADGTYNRGKTKSLGTQGINGWIWGLIALDSMRYATPEGASDTRETIIIEILKAQLSDGGFSLNSPKADPDITAMALQALAPYYNSEEVFTYEQKSVGETVSKTTREVIDEALHVLSESQSSDGDYESMDTPNIESTAQVMVALTSLGINPLTDDRFIKNGNTLLDGMLLYQGDDGGFVHSKTYDPENPTSSPNESNTMASEQALYAFTSLVRYNENYRTLYDFREEMNEELKEKITSLKESINSIPEEVTEEDIKLLKSLFADYVKIPVEERSYVFNYDQLANAMEKIDLENTSEDFTTDMGISQDGNGAIINLFDSAVDKEQETGLTEDDLILIKDIPDDSTEYYVDIVKLLDKLKSAKKIENNTEYIEELKAKKASIEKIEEEIEALNQLILNKVYPFSEIGIKDNDTVEDVINRYEKLSHYDQAKVQGYDDVEKAETQIDNLLRARYIMIIIGVVVLGMAIILVIRYKRRQKEKAKNEMMDLK